MINQTHFIRIITKLIKTVQKNTNSVITAFYSIFDVIYNIEDILDINKTAKIFHALFLIKAT